jgi:hypothetical protein
LLANPVNNELQLYGIEGNIGMVANAENRTGSGPWWKVSANTTLQSGKPHPCPCNHQPARQHYLLLITVDAL